MICAPTRELAQQIYTETKKLAKVYNLTVVCAYGGGSLWEQQKACEAGCEILICTPVSVVGLSLGNGRIQSNSLFMIRLKLECSGRSMPHGRWENGNRGFETLNGIESYKILLGQVWQRAGRRRVAICHKVVGAPGIQISYLFGDRRLVHLASSSVEWYKIRKTVRRIISWSVIQYHARLSTRKVFSLNNEVVPHLAQSIHTVNVKCAFSVQHKLVISNLKRRSVVL